MFKLSQLDRWIDSGGGTSSHRRDHYTVEVSAPRTEKTDVPGVYRRGRTYVYSYRKRGKQRWGTARTKTEARRLKRTAETDVERGEHRDGSRETFGAYAREWIDHYGGRTSKGIRDSTRTWYRQMLEARLIPYFDLERGLRLAEIEPRDVKALIAWLATQPNPHAPSAHALALDDRLPRRRHPGPLRRCRRGGRTAPRAPPPASESRSASRWRTKPSRR